jgi:hypothetical protein
LGLFVSNAATFATLEVSFAGLRVYRRWQFREFFSDCYQNRFGVTNW